jgi:hypothetical protein
MEEDSRRKLYSYWIVAIELLADDLNDQEHSKHFPIAP